MQQTPHKKTLIIQEPTLEIYFYFLRRVEGDTLQTIQECRVAFQQEIQRLLAHLEQMTGQAIPFHEWAEDDNSRRVSQIIQNTGWLDGIQAGLSCFAATYIYGDVYCLQTGYCQSGQAGPEVFVNLRQLAWKPFDLDHLLGSSNYLCGITTEKDQETAVETLKIFANGKFEDVISTHLHDLDASLYGVFQQPFVTALFYPNEEREAQIGTTVFNNRAPRLEVYKHKIDRQLAWCTENFGILSAQSQTLDALLIEIDLDAFKIDKALARQLVQRFRVYEGNLEILSERQMTIETNLHNLDVVLKEFGPLTEDALLHTIQENLWERRGQLEQTLDAARRIRGQTELAIQAVVTRLGLQRPAELFEQMQETVPTEKLIRQDGFPGALPPFEKDLPLPEIEVASEQAIALNDADVRILQHVYRGYKKLIILKEFHGGATCRHALLTQPIGQDGYERALRVSKIGAASGLLTEQINYRQYVGDTLPFFTAPLEWERYYAEGDLAGLSYLFVGGGGLGETMELEEYYQQAEADQKPVRISQTLSGLLHRELGELWYGKFHSQNDRSLEAEYGIDLFEHLRLRLRPNSPDSLWTTGAQPPEEDIYQHIEIATIPAHYHSIPPGTLLGLQGLTVSSVKRGIIKLRDEENLGVVVRVETGSQDDLAHYPMLNSKVGIRGEVIYNRHGKMKDAIHCLFPALSPNVESKVISLPDTPGTFPNPLYVYPRLLKKKLSECRKSYVHGDLHMRNVLVDSWGISRLIDFAEAGERHNLFDFIRLEGYLRYLTLGSIYPHIPLQEYIQFEESLVAAALGKNASLPKNPHLRFARETIFEIRRIARNYLADEVDLIHVYLPALFLHCLIYLRYDQKSIPYGIQLTFATACVLARETLGSEFTLEENSISPPS